SSAELAEAQNAGMRIELHTHRQFGVNNPDRDIAREIADNSAAIAQPGITGEKRHFCYPSGGTAEGAERLLASCGIASATTTRRMLNPPGTNPYRLGRLLDGYNVSQLSFEAWLAGVYPAQRRQTERASLSTGLFPKGRCRHKGPRLSLAQVTFPCG